MEPLVSIVIPSYNHESFISQTLLSIFHQTYRRIELIIIDDGSSDQSIEIIENFLYFHKQRFERVVFKARHNKGLCRTINECLALCRGKYFSLIASDDVMLAMKTQIQVNYLESNPEVCGIFSAIEMIDDEGLVLGSRISNRVEYSFEEIMLNKHDLPTLTQMFRLADIISVGGYDVNVKIEDWYMLLKLSYNKKILRYLPEILCQYRYHPNNSSKNKLFMAIEMRNIILDYDNHKIYHKSKFKLDKEILKINVRPKSQFLYFVLKLRIMLMYWAGIICSILKI